LGVCLKTPAVTGAPIGSRLWLCEEAREDDKIVKVAAFDSFGQELQTIELCHSCADSR